MLSKLIDMYFSKNVLPFWCILLMDSMIVFLSSLFVYWMSNRTGTMFEHRYAVLYTALLYTALSWIGAKTFKTYSGIVRYSSFVDLMKVAYANTITLVLAVACSSICHWQSVDALTAFTPLETISGSGSVGIGRCDNMEEVLEKWNDGKFTYIIQELMTGGDCDADVYVDCISHKPVAVFSKKKIESRIGGASKTISYKDQKLFDFVEEVCSVLELNGPCDMDFFIKDGEYYLSEINPRFGGAYLHAYGAGVDFVKLILNNIDGKENKNIIGNYDEDIIMMMYDDVVITRKEDLLSDNFSLL